MGGVGRLALVMTVVGAGVVLTTSTAAAHGPCHCLSPSAGPPGTIVSVPESYGAVEVLWNPNPRRLGNPALVGSKWGRLFDPDARTTSLAKQDDPGGIEFEVPRVPDGRYLVVIFDLSEGGPRNHYTWGTFSVERGPILPATGAGLADAMGAALVAIVAGIVLGALVSRDRKGIRRD